MKKEKVISFTIDVDRDAAFPMQGRVEGITRGKGKASFESSARGLADLCKTLYALRIPGTFFFEAKTALELEKVMDLKKLMKEHEVGVHGLEHEDFTGKNTGITLTGEEKSQRIREALSIVKKVFPEHFIRGFRAPYLHVDGEVIEALKENKFDYDSSFSGKGFKPSKINELPISEWVDSRGKKMSGYLWALMEGKRKVSEYVDEVRKDDSEIIVLATHSWHSVHSVINGPLPRSICEANSQKVYNLLKQLKHDYKFVTANQAIKNQPSC